MRSAKQPTVYLIGGAPGVGKSTLGAALAAALGLTSLSIDDLVTAVQAVTTPESHPGLHLMWRTSHLDYFTEGPAGRLIDDGIRQHAAAWPFFERVIHQHARGGPPIVIDGWHLWPRRVAGLNLDAVWAAWLVAEPAVLIEREKGNTGFLLGSADPERMLAHFLARSLWFNEQFEREAVEFQMSVLHQPGNRPVDDLCRSVLEELKG